MFQILLFSTIALFLLIQLRYSSIRIFLPNRTNGVAVFESTVKILKFGTPQTIAIIVLKIEMFDVTLH